MSEHMRSSSGRWRLRWRVRAEDPAAGALLRQRGHQTVRDDAVPAASADRTSGTHSEPLTPSDPCRDAWSSHSSG